ncbi:centromere protein Q [Tiliqua scincoides]|uniref:centromere protein Q n=1 Tax=Tiliqua scincoides TaxID=71010 RepID=UPI003461CBEB
MKGRTSQDHQESSSRKQGKDGSGRKKRSKPLGKEARAVRKKKMQQRAESPKETTSLDTKVVKVSRNQRAKWQLLSKSTRMHLESMMNWLIVSLLYENAQSHRETERHLNLLKERILKRFETLKVPVQKMSCLQNVCKVLAKEKKHCESLEEGLALLQEEIDEAAQAATLRDDNIQSLQVKVEELKCELAAEEKTASKLFQRDGNNDLALPELSKHSLEAPLIQKRFLKIQNQERILNYLNSIQ